MRVRASSAHLAEPTHSRLWVKFVSKIYEYSLAVPARSANLRVRTRRFCAPTRRSISQIFLLRAPVTQMGVTSSRKLGIMIRTAFCKLDSRGFPKTCSSTPNSIQGGRYGFCKLGILHTPSQFQLFFLLFAFKPSLYAQTPNFREINLHKAKTHIIYIKMLETEHKR